MVKTFVQLVSLALLSFLLSACAELEESLVCTPPDSLPGIRPPSAEGQWTLRGSGCACDTPFSIKTRQFSVAREGERLYLSSTPELNWFEGSFGEDHLSFALNYQLEGELTPSQLEGKVTSSGDNFFEGSLTGKVLDCEDVYGHFVVEFNKG